LKLVIMKRGGGGGEVAVNVDRVTYVAATPGPFTDIYFGDLHVTVEGTFQFVCARLSLEGATAAPASDGDPPRNWVQQRA
jgi:hypothetical protein